MSARLNAEILAWAAARNFFGEGGATVFSQSAKLVEEIGELMKATAKNDAAGIVDGIGDVQVVNTIIAKLHGGIDMSFACEAVGDLYAKMFAAIDTVPLPALFGSLLRSAGAHTSSNDPELLTAAVGCTAHVLAAIARRNGFTFDDCIDAAYQEIKFRRGSWVGGMFVKTAPESPPPNVRDAGSAFNGGRGSLRRAES